jgi:ABC-type nitrate/sulfonate/bicarbonate transport system substrate-binding protein
VASPLIWGIHVPATSEWQQVHELQGRRYAISRMGSGSHLMAFVDARQRGWQLKEEQLVIVGDLNGARQAFKENKADIFMWERFMTQPFVDNGEFRRVGECLTPWPCFVIAARNEVIQQQPEVLKNMLSVIYESSQRFMQNPEAVHMVARRFGIKPEDATAWFAHTKWATSPEISPDVLTNVVQTLFELQLVNKKLGPADLFQALVSRQ